MNFEPTFYHKENAKDNEPEKPDNLESKTSENFNHEIGQTLSTGNSQNQESSKYTEEVFFDISVYSYKAPRALKPEPPKLEDPIEGPFASAFEFATSLSENFSKIDIDGNESISLEEIQTLGKNSLPNTIGSNLAGVLERRLEDLSGLHGFENNKVSLKDADRLESLFKPKAMNLGGSKSVSFGKVMSRSISGGAIGGGIGSSLSGGGYLKGAAVGALFGVVAYGIANGTSGGASSESGSNYFFKRQIDNWNEFEIPIINDNRYFNDQKTAKLINSELKSNKNSNEKLEKQGQNYVDATWRELDLVESTIDTIKKQNSNSKELSPQDIQRRVDSFSSQFSLVDVNSDNKLNYYELARSMNNDQLTTKDKQTAAILAKNIDVISKFNDNTSGELYITQSNLSNTTEMFEEYTFIEKLAAQAPKLGKIAFLGGLGCVPGSIFGFLAGSPPVGCAIGASAVIGLGEGFEDAISSLPQYPLDKKVGTKRANDFRKDVRLLSN